MCLKEFIQFTIVFKNRASTSNPITINNSATLCQLFFISNFSSIFIY